MSFPASLYLEAPYYAVIFTSTRRASPISTSTQSYSETAARMLELAARQPGYLGVESLSDTSPSTAPAPNLAVLSNSINEHDEREKVAGDQDSIVIRSITISYWRTEEDVKTWKREVEHLQAQRRGREEWYESFELRVARVERGYGFPRKTKL